MHPLSGVTPHPSSDRCHTGATMCGIVGQNAHLATSCYAILTAITLLASYQTVKCIPLATLNSTRLHVRQGGLMRPGGRLMMYPGRFLNDGICVTSFLFFSFLGFLSAARAQGSMFCPYLPTQRTRYIHNSNVNPTFMILHA